MKLKHGTQYGYHGYDYKSKTAKHNAQISFCLLMTLDWDVDIRMVPLFYRKYRKKVYKSCPEMLLTEEAFLHLKHTDRADRD